MRRILCIAACTYAMAAIADPIGPASEAQRDTLKDYGFVGIQSQRDAAHQILTVYAAAGSASVQAPGARAVATFLRMFSGGSLPTGDVVKIVTDSGTQGQEEERLSEKTR